MAIGGLSNKYFVPAPGVDSIDKAGPHSQATAAPPSSPPTYKPNPRALATDTNAEQFWCNETKLLQNLHASEAGANAPTQHVTLDSSALRAIRIAVSNSMTGLRLVIRADLFRIMLSLKP